MTDDRPPPDIRDEGERMMGKEDPDAKPPPWVDDPRVAELNKLVLDLRVECGKHRRDKEEAEYAHNVGEKVVLRTPTKDPGKIVEVILKDGEVEYLVSWWTVAAGKQSARLTDDEFDLLDVIEMQQGRPT